MVHVRSGIGRSRCMAAVCLRPSGVSSVENTDYNVEHEADAIQCAHHDVE